MNYYVAFSSLLMRPIKFPLMYVYENVNEKVMNIDIDCLNNVIELKIRFLRHLMKRSIIIW